MRIAVVGLGKLGSPLLGILGSAGHSVRGVDTNVDTVNAIRSRRAPVCEPELEAILADRNASINATNDLGSAVRNSDLTFVVLPTPSGADGQFSGALLVEAAKNIGMALRDRADYHVVAFVSTVMPGTCDNELRHVLELASGRKIGDSIGLCYNPSLVALGNVVHGMTYPDLILIGESDLRAGAMLEVVHRSICRNIPAIKRLSLIDAELAKIAINSFVTSKISFANMLSEICDRIGGADATAVADAIGADPRIGAKYLQPALGYGGPCFPRDNVALSAYATSLGVVADLAEAADRINRRQVGRAVEIVRRHIETGTVAVLGLTYKAGTPNSDESQGVQIANALATAGYRVLVNDPMGLEIAKANLSPAVQIASDAAVALRLADVAVIATPWPEYEALPRAAFHRDGQPLTVVDYWRLESLKSRPGAINLVYPGRAPDE